MNLSKAHDLSEPQFSHPYNGEAKDLLIIS